MSSICFITFWESFGCVFKRPVKRANGGIAYVTRNLGNAFVGGFKHMAGLINAKCVDVIGKAYAEL